MAGDQVVTLRLTGESGQLLATLKTTKSAIGDLGPAVDQVGDRTERSMGRGTAAARMYGSAVSSASGMLRQLALGAAAAVGVGGLAAVMSSSVGVARDYGAAMAEVSTLMSDTSGMAAQSAAVRQLAKDYGQAPTEQAKALYQIISAGATSAAAANETLEASNRLAIGGITDVKTAADGLTTAMNAYGPAVGSATDVSDRMFVAMRAGKTTIGELSASIGAVAPIAAQTGVSLDEVLAATAALTLGGVSTATAMNGIRAAIAAIIKPSTEATELAESLGIQFDAAALKSQGLAQFLDNVKTATGGSAEQMAVLFGGVEALSPVMSLTGNQAAAFAGTLDQMGTAAGSTAVAYEKLAATAEQQFNRLKSAVGDSLLSIGESMLTVLAPAAKALADNWDALADSAVALAQALAVLAGVTAIGAVITSLKSLYAVAAAGAAWQALGIGVSGAASAMKAAGLAGDAFGARLVALAGGPVVVAATALGLLAIEVKKNWDLIIEAEQRGTRSIAMAQGSIGTGLAGRQRPLAGIETDVERLADLMQRDRGREQALERHRASLAALQVQYTKAGGSVEKWNALLDNSTAEAIKTSEASTQQGAALKALDKIAADAGLTSAKLAEANEAHAAALRALAVEEAKGGEAAQRAAAIRIELNEQHAKTIASLTGATEATKANERATREAAEADDDRVESLRRLIEQQQQAADNEYANALLNSEDAAIAASRMVDALREEAAQVGLTQIELQHLAETRQFDAMMRDAQLARTPEQLAALRAEFAEAQKARTAAAQAGLAAARAAQDGQRAWTDFAGDLVDAMSRGMDGVKDLFKRMLADLLRQLLQSQVLRAMSSVFGASMPGLSLAAGSGGQQSMLGAMLGQAGSGSSVLGGLLGGSGILFSGTTGAGVAAQASGAFAGATSSGTAGFALTGGMLAAVAGIGVAVYALHRILSDTQETILRVRSSEFNGDRRAKGIAESQLGSIYVRGESLGDGAAARIAEQIKEFDNAIAGLLDDDQIAAVRARLSAVNDTFRDGAATAEEALGARLDAIVSTMSADVQQYVSAIGGSVEERVRALADALAIEDIVDTGAIGDSFAEVSALLAEYRVGTEAVAATYARVLGSVTLLDEALALSGTSLDMTRAEVIRFATDITQAAGGLERAQSLWSSYFESFYTETERQTYALQQAMQRAADLFTDAGLNVSDFTGEGGAAAFRALFEERLPTLSAAAVVQYLEMAQALGIVIDLSAQASGSIGDVADTLAELMAGVTEQLAEFAPPPTFAQQLAAINTETESLIARATALGATEAELAQIRELGALRVGDVLAQQADAYRQYADLVRGLADEAADLRGLSEYQREMREVERWTQETAAALNAAARAAGMQAAAEEDLALMHEIAAARAAAAMARLEQRGRDLVSQLYGSRLTDIDTQISDVGGAAHDWMTGATGGMNDLTQATDTAVQALIGAQQRVRDWLNGIMSSELSGLRPRDRLTEMLALAERTRTAALGGDAEAFARMPQIADELLRLGRDVYASGSQYFDLRDMVRGWMQELANVVIPEPQPGPGGNLGGVDVGGNTYGGGAVVDLEREQMIAQQAAAERRALAQELSAVIRDLVIATGQPLDEIAATLGFSMTDLVADLGVNLSDMTVATASQLAGIASAMGVELTDLASSVGVSLGSLGDRQSLLNDALEATIGSLPAGQRDLLAPLLRDVEEAAALGDTAGVEAGISAMEDAIAEMAPELRDLLAPYFRAISPADPATELQLMTSVDATLGSSLAELMTHTTLLADINAAILSLGGLQPIPLPGTGGLGPTPPPAYAVGTPWVPQDGLAYLHRGEAVIPASVNAGLRAAGVPGGTSDNLLLAELREVNRRLDEGNADRRRVEQRVQQLEATTARGDADKVRAMERQNDALKSRIR